MLANLKYFADRAPEAQREEAQASALTAILHRLVRLRDPRSAVNLLSTLTARRLVVPEVAEAVQAALMADGAAKLQDLDAHYLSTAAWAAVAQGGTSQEYFKALAARGAQLAESNEEVDEAHWMTLCAALKKVGVEAPARA